MIIYRIQDDEGRGPFRPGFSRYWVDNDSNHPELPSWLVEFPHAMRGAVYGMSHGTGCRTLDQLRQWFSPTEYARLLQFGYHAVSMEVGRILGESPIQCLFERTKPLREDVTPVDLYPDSHAP